MFEAHSFLVTGTPCFSHATKGTLEDGGIRPFIIHAINPDNGLSESTVGETIVLSDFRFVHVLFPLDTAQHAPLLRDIGLGKERVVR